MDKKERTVVLADSGCDVPKIFREKYDIRILPLRVIYPEKDYRDGIDIDPLMVYERFPEEFPSTSTPSYQEVMDELTALKDEGFANVIAVCISSGLSGTFNTIRLVASEMEDLNVFVFDTKNISIGSGLFAIWAGKKLSEGADFDSVCRGMQEKIRDSKVFFYMDTLKYLQRGGRIGHVASMVGEVLKLKPVISCNEEGVYYTVAKIRGARLGKLRMLEEILLYCHGHKGWIVVEEGGAHEEALAMQALLEEHLKGYEVICEQQITATMAINTGPGLVGVAVFREP